MKRGTLIALIAGGVVVVLLWYFLLFSPTSKELTDTRSQVSAAESQKQDLENTVRRLKELSANAPKQAAALRTLRAAIPANPDLGAFILQANDIAAAAGINWLSISPTPPAAGTGSGPRSTIAVAIQVDGTFSSVLDYLNRLEGLDRLVLVDSINVAAQGASGSGTTGGSSASSSGASSGAGGPNLSVTLTGRMFTQAAPAANGSSSSGGSTSGGNTLTPSTPSTPSGGPSSTTTPPASSSGSSS